jgi:hypothetical protein
MVGCKSGDLVILNVGNKKVETQFKIKGHEILNMLRRCTKNDFLIFSIGLNKELKT